MRGRSGNASSPDEPVPHSPSRLPTECDESDNAGQAGRPRRKVPLDPSSPTTECAPGEQAPDPDPTVTDDASFDTEVLRGMGDFLDRLGRFWGPAGSSSESDSASESTAAPGASPFERYELIERVGLGGFGLVFRARDPVLNREVALKVPRPEVLMTPALRRRFLREARAAAALDHPNIVHVHDTGQVGPLCYIASAFCEGPTLSVWLRGRTAPVAARQAARLIQTLAIAVQHAHDRGILHRDLKPSNILLQGAPDEPDLDKLVPRITDFGLAKIADEIGDDTRTDVPMGSPPYMAPEQALGRSRDVDARSDVYALGTILYQVLVGRPPFEADSRVELLRRIVEADPDPPRSSRPGLDRDLETICLRCLEKDRRRRYSTAEALAADLGRYLRGEPIRARPASAWEQAAKWCRRKPWQAAAVFLACALTMALGGVVVWRDAMLRRHNVELQSALDLANRHQAATRRLLYDSRVRLAQQALDSGNAEMSQEVLAGLKPGPDQADLRGFEWHYLNRIARRDVSLLFDHQTGTVQLALGPDDRTLVAGDEEGILVFWDLVEGRERARAKGHSGHVGGLAFSPDGRTLASCTSPEVTPSDVKLWDPAAGRALATIGVSADSRVFGVTFFNGGRTLAVREFHRGRYRSMLWDVSRGLEYPVQVGAPIDCDLLAFSPDGRWLATVEPGERGMVALRDPTTRRTIRTIVHGPQQIFDLAFTRDGRRLVSALEGGLSIRETESGREVAAFIPAVPVRSLQLSPDGDRLAATSIDGANFALIVELSTRPRECIPRTFAADNLRAVFSPDGRALALGGRALAPTIWDTSSGRKAAVFPGKRRDVGDMVFARDGRSLIFTSDYGKVRRWHIGGQPEPLSELAKGDKEVWVLAFSPDGSTLASAGDDHTIKLWNPHDGTLKFTLKGHEALVTSVAFSPDGTGLASASFDNTVRLWDGRDGRPHLVLSGHTDRVRAVAFSPDGRKVASAGSDHTVRMRDAVTGRPLSTFQGHHDAVHAIAFNHNGTILVSASNDQTIKGIDAETGAERFSLTTRKPNLRLAFSPDGMTLASTDDTGMVTLWDTTTWTRRTSIKGSDDAVWGVSFSPDGKTMATACDDTRVRLWDPTSGQMTLELSGHTRRVNAVAFSPDGTTLASCDHAGAIRFWPAGP